MPHVVLIGQLDIPDVFRTLEDIMNREDGRILKTGSRYIAADEKSIILEATVIEPGFKPLNFFALVGRRDDGIVVRIHPTTDPEKTDGVKMLLALIAKQIMAGFPGTEVGKTNLQDYLEDLDG